MKKYISAAKDIYETDEIQIQEDGELPTKFVSESDGGAWVLAWVWVPDEEVVEDDE